MRLISTILAASMLISGTAFAQAPHGVLAADANQDGAVSRAEFIIMNVARFERMDADHNGVLTIAERAPERAPNHLPPLDPNAAWHPGDADANGDRLITRDEFFFNVGIIFSRFDANHDDQIAGDEIAPEASPRP